MVDELLLDTSYLLPIFGVKLEYRDFETVFSKLNERYAIIYNPVSLIEAKWIILKYSRKVPAQRDVLLQAYRKGLLSLEKDPRLQSSILISEGIEELSDNLLTELGVTDYFDRQIYSTAANLHFNLLTEDESLHELFNKSGAKLPKPKKIMKWKNLLVEKKQRAPSSG